jgi:hypothetical protein
MVLGTCCRAKVGKAWEVISIDDALAGVGTDYRCLRHKHESVRPYSKGRDGRAAHFQHIKANKNCDLGYRLSR